MAAAGFNVDMSTGDIKMNRGDTGSFKVKCTRKSGEAWPAESRMLFTIRSSVSGIKLQRIYRLDDQWGLGDGVVLIEFHNADTDTWEPGEYKMERRYNVAPIWDGTPSEARCVNALADGAVKMIEGATVRTVFHGTLTLSDVYGDI